MEILALKTSAVKVVGASPTPPSHKYTWRKSSEDSVAYLRQGVLISLRSMETSVPTPSQPAKVVMSASRQTGNLRFPVFNFFFFISLRFLFVCLTAQREKKKKSKGH